MAIRMLPEADQCLIDFFERSEFVFWLIAHLILIPHAAAIWASYVRWGALPLAIGTSIASLFTAALFFESFGIEPASAIVVLHGCVVLLICGGIHLIVRNRAITVAAWS